MIFLDISLEDFFIKYPTVKIMATDYSKTYRFKMDSLKPYMTNEFIGVYTELKDGRPVAISIPKPQGDASKLFKKAFDTFLQ